MFSRNIESPVYDASEEDNEGLTDDAASSVSIPYRKAATTTKHMSSSSRKHQLAAALPLDSPTYDGDIESTIPDIESIRSSHRASSNSTTTTTTTNTTAATLNTPTSSANLTAEDIRTYIHKAIQGESWRKYKINKPPTDRPVRIYADGVYDLFHFGHALQLRQAKLSFPNVYLLVGVCSDEAVRENKAQGIMTHVERLESVRHCRWVDQVVADAPWVIDESFMNKYQIDYVAHDEDPYVSSGHQDVYSHVKNQGKFIPTRRTPGISTSELLERIVVGYRQCDFDAKLIKMGHEELRAEGSEYDDSRRNSRNPSRNMSPIPPYTGIGIGNTVGISITGA